MNNGKLKGSGQAVGYTLYFVVRMIPFDVVRHVLSQHLGLRQFPFLASLGKLLNDGAGELVGLADEALFLLIAGGRPSSRRHGVHPVSEVSWQGKCSFK